MDTLLGALSWEPQIKGALYVLLAVAILVGSCYMLLATNMGARLGFQLAAAGLFGFLTTIGIVWWVYGIGLVGRSPEWRPQTTVVGDPARGRNEALRGFPQGWKKLQITDPAVADAQPVVDSNLVSTPGGPPRPFKSATEYVPLAAYEKGGESQGPFGIDAPRPFDLFHTPHYLMIQVQKAKVVEPVPGVPPPRPEPDPSAPPISVIVLRDLGSERLKPAIFTLSTAAIFLLLCYQLHTRDRELAAKREQESSGTAGRPQPVSR